MDKILFMGRDSSTKCAIEYCKEMGVYTIVTDYLTPDKNPEKLLADEYWMLDLADLQGLSEKCRSEKVTAVYAGNNEYCIDRTQELTKELGLPFYASDLAWECARDKAKFKKYCMEAGLNVPQTYPLTKPFSAEELARIEYPVIVKPTDACASRGVTICYNEEELMKAYDYAMEMSPSGNVIVEDYIVGVETAPAHFVVDGKIQLTSIDDIIYGERTNGNNMSFTYTPSSMEEEYITSCLDKVQKLCTLLGCKHGNFYFEIIYSRGKFYFLELIHRVDGVGIWTLTEKISGINVIKRMVNIALGYDDPKPVELENPYKCGGIYFYWAKPGVIGSIVGKEEILSIDGVEMVHERYHVGDTIKETNDMVQMAFYVSIVGMDKEDFVRKLKTVTDTLKIYDVNGVELTDPMLPLEKLS